MFEPAPSGDILHAQDALDAVLDVGKTRSKLVVLARDGTVLASADCANTSRHDGAYAALDTEGVAQWLVQALADLGPLRGRLARMAVSTHGAAFAAVEGEQLAWPVPDYEFAGFDEREPGWAEQVGPFDQTCSPDLPRGLNAATQWAWLQRHCPADFARGSLLPYAQYWAWWLCGVASSEVSSLGCHTHLWNPALADFSALAHQRGWAQRMAPLRRAWEPLGPVRPALAQRLGLRPELRVHVGAHDSNACLARYLRSDPRMTLVTTGTWVVVMAPGAPPRRLDPQRDLLANVSVRQERVPTGRFMGGRELQQLCAGANPALANTASLRALVARGVLALPGFETQGGPFRLQVGRIVDAQGGLPLACLGEAERATLAALYTAQVTAWLVDRLGGTSPVIVDGPFARNPVYPGVLAALLPHGGVRTSADTLEGTARGTWMLTHWTEPGLSAAPVTPTPPILAGSELAALQALHARWLDGLGPGLRAAQP